MAVYFLLLYAMIVGSLGLVAGLYACGGGSGSPVSTIDDRADTSGTTEETDAGDTTEEADTGGTTEETGMDGMVEMPDTETVEPAGPRYTPENAPFLGRPTQGPALPPTRLRDFMHTPITKARMAPTSMSARQAIPTSSVTVTNSWRGWKTEATSSSVTVRHTEERESST